METQSATILFVDDEACVLDALKRCLKSQSPIWNLRFATSVDEALEAVYDNPPDMVVTDITMPGRDGLDLLQELQNNNNTVHIPVVILTGLADHDLKQRALDLGAFDLLNKPCPNELLTGALKAGLEQYRLITAERNLLQQTLTGSIRVLTEVLELVNPRAFSRGLRIKPVVKALASELGLKNAWQYEISAFLSQLGSIVLPPEIIEKHAAGFHLNEEEQEIYNSHPASAAKLIENIPRLDKAAKMILNQMQPYNQYPDHSEDQHIDETELGGQILHVALDFDSFMDRGLGRSFAVRMMKRKDGEYNPELLHLLETTALPGMDEAPAGHEDQLAVWQLRTGMIALEDITAQSGMLLVPKGNQMNHTLITRLRNFSNGVGINEPIRVFVPDVPMIDAA